LLDRLNKREGADGEDRQRIAQARAAAEALFSPKQPPAVQPAADGGSAAAPVPRKPRILGITPAHHLNSVASPRYDDPTPTPTISPAQIARLRAYLDYGMTIAQAATVYGVAASEIEHALQKA
jgi:hypothetical protein